LREERLAVWTQGLVALQSRHGAFVHNCIEQLGAELTVPVEKHDRPPGVVACRVVSTQHVGASAGVAHRESLHVQRIAGVGARVVGDHLLSKLGNIDPRVRLANQVQVVGLVFGELVVEPAPQTREFCVGRARVVPRPTRVAVARGVPVAVRKAHL